MPLNRQIKALISQVKAQNLPPYYTLSPAEARNQFQSYYSPATTILPMASIENYRIPGSERNIAVRVYTPEGKGPFPALLYFGGGGFVLGNLNFPDFRCQVLAYLIDCVVISVNYSRAPEDPFPAALNDCYTALSWVAKHPSKLNVDPSRIAVCGENAGGTLAAATTFMARDRDGPDICYQLLIYPLMDNTLQTESQKKYGQGYLLDRGALEWFWKHYLSKPEDADNPYAVPLKATDFSKLPHAQIITAEFDAVRDEDELYATRLQEAGVEVDYYCYGGLAHGFLTMYGSIRQINRAFEEITNRARNFLWPKAEAEKTQKTQKVESK